MIDPNLIAAIVVGIGSFIVIRLGLYWLTDEASKKQKTEGVK